jgi:DNA primase
MTSDEMEQTLKRLGIEIVSTRGSEIQAHCPAHKERTGKDDRNPSWWINAETGQHICFSCEFKGGLYTLIGYVGGVEAEGVKDWLGSTESLLSRFNQLTKESKSVIEEPTHVTESMLSAFVSPPAEALLSRGLTLHAAQYYQVLWDNRKENWILPIRDLDGKLIGWQEKGYKTRHFNNQPAKMHKSKSLFGYQKYMSGDMIVVESPLDTVRLFSLGITGGVATYGTSVSSFQINAIRGADRVIFALDNDQPGKIATSNMFQLCKDMGIEAWFFNYSHTDMKDVGAMSADEIRSGLENAKHIARGQI